MIGRPPDLRPCGWCKQLLSSEQDRTHRKECPENPRMIRAKEIEDAIRRAWPEMIPGKRTASGVQ